ncbi:MAG: hypothetical protein R3C28_11715 [Pirellulaceae bacterium]
MCPPASQYLIGVQHFAGTGTGYTLDVNVDNRRNGLCQCRFAMREYPADLRLRERRRHRSDCCQPGLASLGVCDLYDARRIRRPWIYRVGYDLNRNNVIDAEELIETRYSGEFSRHIVDYPLINADHRPPDSGSPW